MQSIWHLRSQTKEPMSDRRSTSRSLRNLPPTTAAELRHLNTEEVPDAAGLLLRAQVPTCIPNKRPTNWHYAAKEEFVAEFISHKNV